MSKGEKRMMRARVAAVGALAAVLLLVGGCGTKADQSTPNAAPTAGSPASAASAPAAGTQAVSGTRYVVVAEQSKATYTVNEKFLNRQLPNDAVGSTSAFAGAVVVENGEIKPSKVTVDLRTLKSDESRRDQRIRSQGLESDKYPFAEFAIEQASAKIPADGTEVSLKLSGTMKIHGTSKPFAFYAKVSLKGDTLVIHADQSFDMNEFGITPPSIAGMLTVNPGVKLHVDFTGKKS